MRYLSSARTSVAFTITRLIALFEFNRVDDVPPCLYSLLVSYWVTVNDLEHVKALLAAGADWRIANKRGETLRDIVAIKAARPVKRRWTKEKRANAQRVKAYLEVSS